VYRYPISLQTYTMAGKPTEGSQDPAAGVGNDAILARTSDGQEVSIDCSVIFQIDPEQVIRVHIDWQGQYISQFIRPVLRGVIRTKVSQYKIDEVNSSKREDLELDLSNQVRAALADKGLVMDRFLLRNIAFSPEYAASVEQKQVALQQQIESSYQAEKIKTLAQADASATIIRAQAAATATVLSAQAESEALRLTGAALQQNRDLITLRYVDKLSPSIRTLLVPNNAPYFLPLPTFEPEASQGPTPAEVTPEAPPISTSEITPTVTITPIPTAQP
jgi:regulator of protease activity HflC (stomatin/prohibitin superfamily)